LLEVVVPHPPLARVRLSLEI